MSRARDLADLGNNAGGLETLTVSDITDITASATELNYVDGVGSAIQTQIDAKAPKASPDFTGTVDLTGTTLSLDDNQIGGSKVHGGDISGLTRVQANVLNVASGNTLYIGGSATSAPMSNAPTFSLSGFSSQSQLYVVFDPYIATDSHRVHCYFGWSNNSGSTKTFQIHYGRSHDGQNFAHTVKLVGEYPDQSFRHYEGFVATGSSGGTIFDSKSKELTHFQGNFGSWSTSGGTNDIIWTETTYLSRNGTNWGVHYTLELGDTGNTSFTPDTITFKMV